MLAQILNLVQKYLDAKVTDLTAALGTSAEAESATGTLMQRLRYATARVMGPDTTTVKSLYNIGGAFTSASADTFGNWVQLIASTASDIDVVAVMLGPTGSAWHEVEIGTGQSGSETPILTFGAHLDHGVIAGHSGCVIFPLPTPYRISAGTRVSARLRRDIAGAAEGGVSLIYR